MVTQASYPPKKGYIVDIYEMIFSNLFLFYEHERTYTHTPLPQAEKAAAITSMYVLVQLLLLQDTHTHIL